MTGIVELLLALTGLVAVAAIALWRIASGRQQVVDRLYSADETPYAAGEIRPSPVMARHRILPCVAALVVGIGLYVTGIGAVYASALALAVGLLAWQLDLTLRERRILTLEQQLADAVDLVVASLQAGTGLAGALEYAREESLPPVSVELDMLVGRIRLGEEPQQVLRELVTRLPLETVLLFSTTLSVHWEAGGNLTPALATVGRTIRDRIELTRRVRSLTVQSRISMVAVLATTYAIGLLMWNDHPARMEGFLSTSIGSYLAAGAMLLQAVGIVWSNAMSRMRF